MKRSVCVAFLSLLLAVASYGETGINPPTGTDIKPAIPSACLTPSDWGAATRCLDALVNTHPTIFPGAVIGLQIDGAAPQVYAKGTGFTTDSVVSLASVSKPLLYVGLIKLVQDHYASPACTPMTANCVFPSKFETTLFDALTKLDALRGTSVVDDWFNPADMNFPADIALQRDWKSKITIRHIAQMTSGFPPGSLTGYVFCPGGNCTTEVTTHDKTCNPDQPGACRQAYLYNEYLKNRGPAIPNGCRPRPASGPRTFNFDTYYFGNVEAPYKLMRQFERRYSYQPGITGECVLLETSAGSDWLDNRMVRESDIAKFFLGMPLLTEPGKTYHYSQPNLYVAAFLIESLSGQRFDDYLDAKLFTPLNMHNTSYVVYPGTTQYQRLVDIKRIPTTPARTVPDLASPFQLDTIYGADKTWDEPRDGWKNRWPEGGAYSTATDLLSFLNFIRTGKAANGAVLLNAESLALLFKRGAPPNNTDPAPEPVGPRTYAFNVPSEGVYAANGYFATMMRRNTKTCTNVTVLPQIVIEATELDVKLPDYQYHDLTGTPVQTGLRQALIQMLEGTNVCVASPFEP